MSTQAISKESGESLFMPNLGPSVTDNTGRELFRYDFEPTGYLRLVVSEKVDTAEALDILEDLIQMKRREVARKAKQAAASQEDGNGSGESEAGD